VAARAVLHHVSDPEAAMANMIANRRPGGALLLIEPDFLPVSNRRPRRCAGILGRLACMGSERGIDYFIGRTLRVDSPRSA
jgi:hypothetical protein